MARWSRHSSRSGVERTFFFLEGAYFSPAVGLSRKVRVGCGKGWQSWSMPFGMEILRSKKYFSGLYMCFVMNSFRCGCEVRMKFRFDTRKVDWSVRKSEMIVGNKPGCK